MKKLVLVILLLWASVCSGATYYVDSTVTDNNVGSATPDFTTYNPTTFATDTGSDSVYKTVADVVAKGGQHTFYFRKGQTWVEHLAAADGTEGTRTIYSSFGTGARPIIRNTQLYGDVYVTLNGIEFYNNSSSAIPIDVQSASHYAIINDCVVHVGLSSSAGCALSIGFDSDYITVTNSSFYCERTDMANDGVRVRQGSNYGLYENNTFGNSTHYSFYFEGNNATYPSTTCNYNVFRNNTITNTEGALFALQSGSNYNTIEKNIFEGGKNTAYCANLARSFKLLGTENIVRNNIIRDNPDSVGGSGISIEVYQYLTDPVNVAVGNQVYGNIITNIARYPIVIATNGDAGAVAHDNVFKNNIIYANTTSTSQIYTQNNVSIYDNYFHNNLVYQPGQTNVISDAETARSVAATEAANPTHYSNNIQADPLFVNYAGQDYRLQSNSPAAKAGVFIVGYHDQPGCTDLSGRQCNSMAIPIGAYSTIDVQPTLKGVE